MMVHCFPLMILFATQLSYSFYLKPHPINVSESNRQNRSAACNVPYSAFRSFTYSIGLPCLFSHIYFLYRVGSSFTINSAIVPLGSICTSSSISACKNAPGISVTATCHPSLASIAHDIIMASSDTVGELVSAFVVYSRWLLPLAQPLALIVPSLFSFKTLSTLVLSFSLRVSCLLFSSAIVHLFRVVDLVLLVMRYCLPRRISLGPLLCPPDLT